MLNIGFPCILSEAKTRFHVIQVLLHFIKTGILLKGTTAEEVRVDEF